MGVEQAELIMALSGAAIMLFSMLIFSVSRRRVRAEQAYLDRESSEPSPSTRDRPPSGIEPALAGALLNGRVVMRDVFVGIVDLASRGHLTIVQLTPPGTKIPGDWQITRTGAPADTLSDADQTLLQGIFANTVQKEPDRRSPHRPHLNGRPGPAEGIRHAESVRLGFLLSDASEPLVEALHGLRAESAHQGWFHRDPHDHHTTWGWVGGVLFVLGLVLAMVSAIDVMATRRWTAMVGPVLIVVAGLLLASLGRLRTPLSELGNRALSDLRSFRASLQTLSLRTSHPVSSSSGASQLAASKSATSEPTTRGPDTSTSNAPDPATPGPRTPAARTSESQAPALGTPYPGAAASPRSGAQTPVPGSSGADTPAPGTSSPNTPAPGSSGLQALGSASMAPSTAAELIDELLPWAVAFGEAESFVTALSPLIASSGESTASATPPHQPMVWFTVPRTDAPDSSPDDPQQRGTDDSGVTGSDRLTRLTRAIQNFVDTGGRQRAEAETA